MRGRPRRLLFGGLAAAAALILTGRAAAQFYIDYRWYESLGASALWWVRSQNVVLLKGASLLVGGAFVFANLYAVRQSVASVVLPRRVGDLEIAEELSAATLSGAAAFASLVVAMLLTVPGSEWTALAAVRLGVPFGESDPRFQSDLGFWVYWLPFEQALYARVLALVAVVIGIVTFVYALTPSLRWEQGAIRVSPHVRRHLSVLSGCVLLVLAWSYRLDAFETLLGERGAAGAWSWVAHNVHVPARIAMSVGALIGGALVALMGWAGQTRLAFIAASGVLALSLVLGQAAPAIIERTTRGPDPARRELPYEATRAAYTRRAFAADQVEPAGSELRFATPAAAAAGTPVWDASRLRRAVERTRRFGPVAGRPALTAGSGAPLLLAAERPVAGSGEAAATRAWNVVRASATTVGPRGEIVGASESALADEDAFSMLPAIVHDSAGGFLFVADAGGQIASVDVSTTRSRLALALSQQNLRLLTAPPSPARAVLRRDLRERLTLLAPFFVQGAAATPAVAADTLYWVVHLYSASSTYPVSRPAAVGAPGWRYLRHAAVAVVNSFTGRVAMIANSTPDPIARSWADALPGSFTTWETIPESVRRAVPPPVESALAQAAAYAEFGDRGGEQPLDRTLRIPVDDTTAAGAGVPLVLLPIDGGTPALSIPVTGTAGRLTGLAVALGGVQPRTAWIAVDALPTDPSYDTVLDRLRRGLHAVAADAAVAVAGTERVVPVLSGAAYVLPHYIERAGAAPLLAGVTTYLAGEYQVGPTTAAALGPPLPLASGAYGGAAAPGDSARDGPRQARLLYDAARAALRAGDWAAFGRAYDALGAALGRERP